MEFLRVILFKEKYRVERSCQVHVRSIDHKCAQYLRKKKSKTLLNMVELMGSILFISLRNKVVKSMEAWVDICCTIL